MASKADSKTIQIFKRRFIISTKAHHQLKTIHRNLQASLDRDLTMGEALKIHCPNLDLTTATTAQIEAVLTPKNHEN